MRLSLPVVLGALFGVAHSTAVLARRDNTSSANKIDASGRNAGGLTSSPSDGGSGSGSTSTPTGGDGGSSSSSATPDETSTTTSTLTVTVTTTGTGTDSTTTASTTDITTSTVTATATSTEFITFNVTGHDETATSTVYSTTTVWQKKRALDIAALPTPAVPVTAPARVDAVTTRPPWPASDERRNLDKRALVTVTVTTTVTVGVAGGGSVVTVTKTAHRTAVTTEISTITTSTTITQTVNADATTTVTTTRWLTVTSRVSSTGGAQIITGTAPDSEATAPASGGGGGGGGSSKGLSTGAKIGIGVGAGVGGLAVLSLLVWSVMRRRDHGISPDADDLIGASEVPIGHGGGTPPMGGAMSSNAAAASALLGTGRHPPSKPVSPEGYRGTAMGDGRSGFAKPESYSPPFSDSTLPSSTSPVYNVPTVPEMGPGAHAEATPAAELGTDGSGHKWYDPNASEIDSRPVMSHQSGPVYEMPTQNYR